MAALSCYQPCRSHLAQPARCLDDEEDHRQQAATLSLRRRQFIERCHEARDARYRDVVPEVSVKKTRDELTKHASQTTPLSRRLNVESGWSKVEEVRKKFEAAADCSSFSRSFESPPRRRLADSLFASFKLPRKKTADNMAASRSLAPQQQQKRKSAVELLAETKAFYVKSETVLDRKQELPLRVSSGLSQAIAAGGCHLVSSGALNNETCCNPYATTRSVGGTRRAVSAGEGLQNTLRRLLEHCDSRENVYSPPRVVSHKYPDSRRHKDYPDNTIPRSHHTSGTFSGTSSSGTSGSKAQKSDPDHREKMNRPLSFGDARVFFPESFVIPRHRPSEVMIKNAFSIPSSHSSPENMELPEPVLSRDDSPTDQIDTISPPAQYAHSAPRYIRSNSHSQPSMREDESGTNINSHKSLPDLHSQARCYPEHSNQGGTDTIGRSPRRRRHSGHQRTASCSSKGTRSGVVIQIFDANGVALDAVDDDVFLAPDTHILYMTPEERDRHERSVSVRRAGRRSGRRGGRSGPRQGSRGRVTRGRRSNHSSLMSSCDAFSEHPSPGEENYQSYTSRCGSSFARDSGGSSGHYTQRSAPPHAQPHRTDSANSTQHEHASRHNWYCGEWRGGGDAECYVSAPPQFQDGAPSPPSPPASPPPAAPLYPHPPHPPHHPRVGIHFQASAPPPQFQDEPPLYDYGDYECSYKTPVKCVNVRKEYINRDRDYSRYHEPNTEVVNKQPQYSEARLRRVDDNEYVSACVPAAPDDVTSPLGTFKRQRCLRYKQRRPRPILRSKSDISDRYRRSDGRSPASAPCEGEETPSSPSEESLRLRTFFERLGLEPRQYEALVSAPPDSPVFFSSASTVDSNALPAAADYTVQGPGVQKQIYRNTEPPSVVERNARIIKWLCQCRKTQMQTPQ